MEVIIKDFNCIENIELEFKPGFTILQGPSNSGKSSAIKAIENTIFNQSGTTNVRQGKDNYIVGIKKDDNTVSLIKGKNSKYKINGQIYEKFGVSQLPEVADALNIRETILGGEKVRLNFSKQMSYPFLLDKTPGQLYKFIVDSSESESLSNVLKDISKDIKDNEKAVVQNEAQMDILIKQQTDLNYKLLHADAIVEVSNKILELDTVNTKIDEMVKCKDTYNSLSQYVSNLLVTYNKLNINIDISGLDKLKEDYIVISNLVKTYKDTLATKEYLNSKLSKLNIDLSIDELGEGINKYNELKETITSYKECLVFNNLLKTKLDDINKNITECKNKLNGFKVCPLCGSEIKC